MIVSAVIAGVALTALTGTLLGSEVMTSWFPGHPMMRPIAGIGFLFAAAGLAAISLAKGRAAGWATVVVGAIIASAAGTMLAAYFGGQSTFSPYGVLNFLFVGISLSLITAAPRLWRSAGSTVAMAVMVIGYGGLLGHLYQADRSYGMWSTNGMSIPAAALFILLGAAIVTSNPKYKPLRLIVSHSLGGRTARRLVPAVVLLPTLIGWVRVMGQDAGLFDTGSGAAFTILTIVILMFGMILYYSYTVHVADQRRSAIETELIEKEQRYRDLFDYSQGMICIHDLTGRIQTVNPATIRSLGYTEAEIVGRQLVDFLPDDGKAGFSIFLREIENSGLSSGLLPLMARDGRRVIWRYTSILIAEPGKEPFVVGHAQDVTELIEAQNQLKSLSLTDDLTGLYNRRGFLTLADQQLRLERHKKTARGLTLMFADLDGLKAINDAYGHEEGSRAIKTFANVLKAALRGADLICRWGGDEFVILTIGSEEENSEMLVDRIRERLDEYNASSGKPYTVAFSVGIAPVEHSEDLSFDEIVARADAAMYLDKRRRKAERSMLIPPRTETVSIRA